MCLQRILQNYLHKKTKSPQQSLSTAQNDTFSLESSLGGPNTDRSLPLSMTHKPRIIIIGAGAAGLACATKLLEFGFDNILILEAENRIGGRIHTHMFADNVVDLGAQWVHGEVNNIVYQMVHDRDWLDTSGQIYSTFDCIRSNGEVVPAVATERLKALLKEIFDNCTEELAHYEGSFGEYLRERFREALQRPTMRDIDVAMAAEFFENFLRIESSETASGVEEVSARGFLEYRQCPGDYLLNWKDKGYVTFLHMLMGSNDDKIFGALEELIRFSCHVDHIEWHHLDGQAKVTCDSGRQEYEADHVIITVSLGVLKARVDSMFHPPLPIAKKQAIVGLGYGSVGKIYLEFPHKFWPDNWYGFNTLWLQEDLEELRKSPYEWVEEIFGFYCVNYQPRVLLAWIVGSYVLRVERMAMEEVKMGCMHVLRRFLCQWDIPDPVNIQITRWQTNPNFAGAYSFRSMLSEELHATALQLAQPITVMAPQYLPTTSKSSTSSSSSLSATSSKELATGGSLDTCSLTTKPMLLFAGEATSMHHYSTVHGAVESGYREANRLINYYSKLQ